MSDVFQYMFFQIYFINDQQIIPGVKGKLIGIFTSSQYKYVRD